MKLTRLWVADDDYSDELYYEQNSSREPLVLFMVRPDNLVMNYSSLTLAIL